jgi:hypothetical protein
MSDTVYKEIEDCLGEKAKRYFSDGFRHIKYEYNNLMSHDKITEGSVKMFYDWEYKQEKHCHIGTVEYIAIALFIAEKKLKEYFLLSESEIALSWISSFHMKISEFQWVSNEFHSFVK